MATSDNVVRAGLTPKPKDVATLVSMLTYNTFTANDIVINGTSFENSRSTTIYKAPVPEFSVLKTILAPGASELFRPFHGPSILICVSGDGELGKLVIIIIINVLVFNMVIYVCWKVKCIITYISIIVSDETKVALCKGSILFVGADQGLRMTCKTLELVIFRAFTEL